MLNNNTSNNNTSADSTLIGFLAKARNKKVQKRIISLLSVVVLLLTLNQTKLIADTLQRIPMCGIAEHMHDEVCVNEAGEYVCGLEEHAHTDACYQQRPVDIEEAVEAEELETDGLEAPVTEVSLELSDEGEIAELASTVDDEAIVSGDIEAIPAETVVELGEDEVTVDSEPADTIAVMPTESEASSPVFDFEGRDYVALSEILPVLPLQMEEVVDVLAVLNEDQETSPIIIEKAEQDYTIYVIERFAWTDIAVETAEGLKTITLIDGGTREEDLRLQTEETSVAAEETAVDAEVQSDGGSEEQTVGTDAEGEEQTVAALTEDEEEQTAVTPTEGEEEQTETVPAEGEEEQAVDAAADEAEQAVDAAAEGAEQAVAAPTEEEEEQTVAAPTDGEEEQTGEGQSDEEATDEGTDAHADGDEEGDTSVAVEGAEDEEQTGESAVEEETDESAVVDETVESEVEDDDVADKVQEQQPEVVADGFHTVIDLSEVETLPLSLREIVGKMEAKQSVIEQSAVEPAVTEETDAPQPEVIEEQITEDAQSLEADDERPLDAQADNGQIEALLTENIESMDVEPASEEVVVELGEEQAEDRHDDTVVAKAAADETVIDNTTVDYNSALLSLTPIMEGEIVSDYSIDVIADFDSTDIIVDGQYTITLLNGVNPWPAQSFYASTEYMNVSVTADAGAFPAGTTMDVSDVVDDETISGIADSVNGNFVEVERVHAVDISFKDADGQEIEPRIPISVVMTVKEQIAEDRETVVVHMDNEGETSVVETSVVEAAPVEPETESAEEEAATVAFTSDSFSVYAVVVTRKLETNVLASDGENYKIEVTYGPDAGIPDGAVLAVSEVTEDEEYRAQVEAGLAGNKMITLARFFDIKIMESEAEDAEEIHPAEAVEVRVWLEDEAPLAPIPAEEPQDAGEAVVQIAEETVEEIAIELGEDVPADTSPEAEQIPEETDNHVVTVGDPTACAAHFADDSVVDVLDAEAADDAVVFTAESFSVWGVVYTVDFYYGNYEWHMDGEGEVLLSQLFELLHIEEDAAAVADVQFTNPELLAVEKVEADWKLTSLDAFDTEEKLTVRMEDGTVYEIRVEDAQYPYHIRVSNTNRGYISGGDNAVKNGINKIYSGAGKLIAFDMNANSGNYGVIASPVNAGNERFVFWLDEAGESIASQKQGDGVSYQITNDTLGSITSEKTFIAYFVPQGETLTVVKPTVHGTVVATSGELRDAYEAGTVYPKYCFTSSNTTLTATPESGYFFKGWYSNGTLFSKDAILNVTAISQDIVLEAIFENMCKYTVMTNGPVNNVEPGYFTQTGAGAFSGNLTTYTGNAIVAPNVSGYCTIYNNTYPHANSGYEYAFWLTDDGKTPSVLGSDGNHLRGSGGGNAKNLLDRNTTYIAWFAPSGQHIVRVNWAEPNDGRVYTSSSSGMGPRSVTTTTNSKVFFVLLHRRCAVYTRGGPGEPCVSGLVRQL